MTKLNVNYWNEETQQAIIEYINEPDHQRRSIIYQKHIHQQLLTMSEAILQTYFLPRNKVDADDIPSLINDAVTHVVQYGFKNYKGSGSSFSYFQTAVKHFYHDKFNSNCNWVGIPEYQRANNISTIEDIQDEVDSRHNYTIDQDNMEDLREQGKEYVKNIIESSKVTPAELKVLKAVYELFTMQNYNRHFSTFFLMKKTGLPLYKVREELAKFKLDSLVYSQGNMFRVVQNYQHDIMKYLVRTDFNYIEAFNLYADDREKERLIKIEANTKRRNEKRKRKAESLYKGNGTDNEGRR